MDLLIFIRNLWEKKWHLLAFCLVPSLVFGSYLYFGPRAYLVKVDYSVSLDAVGLQKLTARFYSGENIHRLIGHLEKQGATKIADHLKAAETEQHFRKVVEMAITPDYVDFENKKNIRLSFERTWADNVNKLEELTADFLTIYINGDPKKDLEITARWVKHNFENELPLYEVHDELIGLLQVINEGLSDIDDRRQETKLFMERSQKILDRLKSISTKKTSGDSGYQVSFNFSKILEESVYMPLDMQIQSYESEVARFTENLAGSERTYQFYEQKRAVVVEVSNHLAKQLGTAYDLKQFQDYLTQLMGEHKSEVAQDFLKSQVRKVDNIGLYRRPLTDQVTLVPLPKGTVKKTGFLALGLLLMGLLWVAFLSFLDKQNKQNRSIQGVNGD